MMCHTKKGDTYQVGKSERSLTAEGRFNSKHVKTKMPPTFQLAAFKFSFATSAVFDRRRSLRRPKAVREGFEPSVQFPVRQFSKLILSASQAPHLYSIKPRFWDCKYSNSSKPSKKNLVIGCQTQFPDALQLANTPEPQSGGNISQYEPRRKLILII